MPAVFDRHYVKRLDGPNVKKGKNKKDLADQVIADIRQFKNANNCDRMVVVWAGSTEIFTTEAPCHKSLAAFEKGLVDSDPAIASSMIYAYAAIRMGIPYANAAPNLSADVPALMELAAHTKSPMAGKDMKTGQTLIKTIIAPALAGLDAADQAGVYVEPSPLDPDGDSKQKRIYFESSLRIQPHGGETVREVKSINGACEILIDWPHGKRGPFYQSAREVVQAALEGKATPAQAREAFAALAAHAGILIGDSGS